MIQPRLARPGDYASIMEIIHHAQAYIRTFGIDQWQDGYPEPECIQADIDRGIGWVFDDDGRIAGYCVLLEGREPVYDTLEGHWHTDGDSYLTVHRMAIDDGWRGSGLSRRMFAFAEARAASAGLLSVRADTHTGNLAMRRVLEKCGFAYCGTVSYAGLVNHGDPIRVAYEKKIGTAGH